VLQWASLFLITDRRAYCIARHHGRGGSLPSSATSAKIGLTRWTRFALPRSGSLEGDWLGEPRVGGRRLVQVLGADDGEILFLTAWGGGRHLAKPLGFFKLCGNGLPSGSRPSIISCGTSIGYWDTGLFPATRLNSTRRICGYGRARTSSGSQPTGLSDYTLTQLDDSCSTLSDKRPCGTQTLPRYWSSLIQMPLSAFNPILSTHLLLNDC
jgi:hypothetical protein